MEPVLDYPYKPKVGAVVMVILFFGFCSYDMAGTAYANHRGLILNHLIRLDPEQASVFYYVLSAGSLIFVVLGVAVLLHALFGNARVTLSADLISIPHGLLLQSAKNLQISDISALGIGTMRRYRFLILVCRGRKYRIASSWLPSESAFDDLHQAIVLRIRNSRSATPNQTVPAQRSAQREDRPAQSPSPAKPVFGRRVAPPPGSGVP